MTKGTPVPVGRFSGSPLIFPTMRNLVQHEKKPNEFLKLCEENLKG